MIGQVKALPLQSGVRMYVQGFDKKVAAQYATVVDKPEKAVVAIIRLDAPLEPRKGFIEGLLHHGDLDFKGEKQKEILDLLQKVPTLVNLYLDGPAVVPEIAQQSAGLLANFGATNASLLDVIFGKFSLNGRLPVELPSSMEAVRNQKEDVPYDSKDPLFPFGFVLSY